MEQKGFDFGGAEKAPRRETRARRSLTVSELTERIQGLLETEFVDVWVEGEVSNLKAHTSGHLYFSLKDDRAQLRAVIWKSDLRYVKFRPKDGARVLARGQIRVYPPKGEYQIQVQVLEPLGKGSLQQAFEELKERLAKEGLFDAERKRPLPLLPRRIGVVTSPTGAVIQDILRVLESRYQNLEVILYPARVQGPEAAGEIVQGIRALNRVRGMDVILVARGGGSLEDLWPFNEESVARALAASHVPTISAVGHETDFTIADFVADLRAPTPSAAAERVVQAKQDLRARVEALRQRLDAVTRLSMTKVRARVQAVTSHRVFEAERGRTRTHAQRVLGLEGQARSGLGRQLERAQAALRQRRERLEAFRWDRQLATRREQVSRLRERLASAWRASSDPRRAALGSLAGVLDSLSPLAVLSRGYALVWEETGRRLVRDSRDVDVGEAVEIRLHRGSLSATVTAREEP